MKKLVIFIAIILLLSISVFADPIAEYQAFVSNNHVQRYSIIDIDGNGAPELLVGGYIKPGVYTIKNNKVKAMATGFSQYEGPWYSTKKHTVVLLNHGSGWTHYIFYKISGRKAKKIATYTADKDYTRGKIPNGINVLFFQKTI